LGVEIQEEGPKIKKVSSKNNWILEKDEVSKLGRPNKNQNRSKLGHNGYYPA